jgi:hypothetical protein
MRKALLTLGAATLLGFLCGCATTAELPAPTATPSPASAPPPAPAVPVPSAPVPSSTPVPGQPGAVEGTVVRFASSRTTIDVTIGPDNATVRDFISMLPVTTRVEEFAGSEKIAYLPRELDVAGSPGSDPGDGDLIYYAPWGNLGFYYDAAGVGYSDQTIHLGTFDATATDLNDLVGADVTIEVVG